MNFEQTVVKLIVLKDLENEAHNLLKQYYDTIPYDSYEAYEIMIIWEKVVKKIEQFKLSILRNK